MDEFLTIPTCNCLPLRVEISLAVKTAALQVAKRKGFVPVIRLRVVRRFTTCFGVLGDSDTNCLIEIRSTQHAYND